MFSRLCIRELAVIALGVSAIASLHGQNPISPTVSQDPTVIDQVWQKASSKYDPERAALLKTSR